MEPAEINAHLVEDNILLRNRVDTLQRQLGVKEQRLAEAEALNEDYQDRLRAVDREWSERASALDDAQATLRAVKQSLTNAVSIAQSMRGLFPGPDDGSRAWENFAQQILRTWFGDSRTASTKS